MGIIAAMPAVERSSARATQRASRLLDDLGRQLRIARVARGLSQKLIAQGAGVSQGQVSLIERGTYPTVSLATLVRMAAAVGLDLSAKLYPGGQPIRDVAHAALLARFRGLVGEGWQWASEVPLPLIGDLRAWDRVLHGAALVVGVEAETRPTDMQELQRRLALKKRDGRVDRLVLVLADTEWCRRLVRLNDLEGSFPVPAKVALRALREGRDPGGDAVILV